MMQSPERIRLTDDLEICRLLVGMWQVAPVNAKIDPLAAVDAMLDYFDAGYTTFDMADHYGDAELFLGRLRERIQTERGEDALSRLQAFTKWVPDCGEMTREIVEVAVDLSLQRMQSKTLDMLQFHWWDYSHPGLFDALKHLTDLVQEGKIRHLSLTNFDTEHLEEILLHGFEITTHQVQYSIIDRRPEEKMLPLCREKNIGLLTYGTLCGGLISEKYLDVSEPSAENFTRRSLKKYKEILDVWGDWKRFQKLLVVLKEIAEKHSVAIPHVAARFILDKPGVAGVIVGCRLGVSEHIAENLKISQLRLDEEDRTRIETARQGNNLMQAIGDCGDEYRKRPWAGTVE